MPHTYPIMLDVADRLIVIVGGGSVAVRKAKTLIECGATRVRCIAPEIHPEMPGGVERMLRSYERDDLKDAALVFASTNRDDVNAQVLSDARRQGVLVNRADADGGEPGDFSTPAQLRESAITITVSTGGNPALAARIRDDIRERWDVRWTQMADAMNSIRPTILARRDIPQNRRAEIFRALATNDAITTFSGGGSAALSAWLTEKFPELRNA